MTLSRNTSARKFQFVDTKPNTPKKQIFIFGSIVASTASIGAISFILLLQYLHNPEFHMFIQSKGIFL